MRRVALLLVVAACGCGKVVGDLPFDAGDGGVVDGGGGPVDARAGDAPVSAVDTVRELRQSMPRPGDGVMLRGVVVTGRSVARGVGIVYVQDPGGGMGAGIRLLCVLDTTCPTTRGQIEALALGQILDVNGVFDITPAPMEPQVVRFGMVNRGTGTAMATVVDATLVAHDRAGESAVAPWLGSYVRVNGPLSVTSITPAPLRESCEAIDAGSADAYRGVFMRPTGGQRDIAVQTIELDTCVSQCGVTCGSEIRNNDTFSSVTGVLIVGERGAGTPELLIRPSRDADLPR